MATALASAADLEFDALVRQGLGLLPVVAPEWTDHNPSDPGVTLIELLAYVTDALLYRAAHVGVADRHAFLRLLRGAPASGCDASSKPSSSAPWPASPNRTPWSPPPTPSGSRCAPSPACRMRRARACSPCRGRT